MKKRKSKANSTPPGFSLEALLKAADVSGAGKFDRFSTATRAKPLAKYKGSDGVIHYSSFMDVTGGLFKVTVCELIRKGRPWYEEPAFDSIHNHDLLEPYEGEDDEVTCIPCVIRVGSDPWPDR